MFHLKFENGQFIKLTDYSHEKLTKIDIFTDRFQLSKTTPHFTDRKNGTQLNIARQRTIFL